jgi:hypothetical protein
MPAASNASTPSTAHSSRCSSTSCAQLHVANRIKANPSRSDAGRSKDHPSHPRTPTPTPHTPHTAPHAPHLLLHLLQVKAAHAQHVFHRHHAALSGQHGGHGVDGADACLKGLQCWLAHKVSLVEDDPGGRQRGGGGIEWYVRTRTRTRWQMCSSNEVMPVTQPTQRDWKPQWPTNSVHTLPSARLPAFACPTPRTCLCTQSPPCSPVCVRDLLHRLVHHVLRLHLV